MATKKTVDTKPEPVFVTLDAIAAADDIPREPVDVPEWGGQVLVRGLNRGEARELGEKLTEAQDDGDMAQTAVYESYLLSHGLVNPALPEDKVNVLAGKSNHVVGRVLTKIQSLSALELEPSRDGGAQNTEETASLKRFPD